MTREGGWLDSKLDLTHTIEISRQPPTHAHAHVSLCYRLMALPLKYPHAL